MTDVHEETQFGITHLLSVDMFLEALAVLLPAAVGYQHLPEDGANHEEIEAIRPCRTVPWAVDNDGKYFFWRLNVITYCFYAEAVGAWR